MSPASFVLIGIRVLCGFVFLAFVIHDFRHHGWLRVLGDIALAISVLGITYRGRQGIA